MTNPEVEAVARAIRLEIDAQNGWSGSIDFEPIARAALAAMPPQAPGWRPIAEAPPNGTAVLYYYGSLEWRDTSEEVVFFGKLRAHVERAEIGWYENDQWLESGTGHGVFEDWRSADQLPTHWMLLPAPPEIKP